MSRRHRIDRRTFCVTTGGTLASLVFAKGCRSEKMLGVSNDGRILARPQAATRTTAKDEQMLGLDVKRDAVLRLPSSAGSSPLPLLILLHGAGQSSDVMLRYLGTANEEPGVAVLAPNSQDYTWDAIRGAFGSDVDYLNLALERVFKLVDVDPTRIAVGGFSDGASYAISLGLINGDLFNRVVAFSPGFVVDGKTHGRPKFFISHGTRDHILLIDRCGRRISADLKDKGYEVTFREFDGDHAVPAAVAREALTWIAATTS
jgi:predicted esterase